MTGGCAVAAGEQHLVQVGEPAARGPERVHRPLRPSASSAASSSVGGGASRTSVPERPTAASAAGRSLRHMAAGAAATSSLVRPLTSPTAGGPPGPSPARRASSFLWSSSHCSLPPSFARADEHEPPAQLLAVQVEVQLARRDRVGGVVGAWQAPRCPMSHTITSPPPYSPRGMTPSKSKYSSGWSSTWTASWRAFGSSVGPFGTAQLTSTPSISRRKS